MDVSVPRAAYLDEAIQCHRKLVLAIRGRIRGKTQADRQPTSPAAMSDVSAGSSASPHAPVRQLNSKSGTTSLCAESVGAGGRNRTGIPCGNGVLSAARIPVPPRPDAPTSELPATVGLPPAAEVWCMPENNHLMLISRTASHGKGHCRQHSTRCHASVSTSALPSNDERRVCKAYELNSSAQQIKIYQQLVISSRV